MKLQPDIKIWTVILILIFFKNIYLHWFLQIDLEAENAKAFLIVNEIIVTLKDVRATFKNFVVVFLAVNLFLFD